MGTYQLRRAFDRDYAYLDGNRIDGKISQELRINPGGRVAARGLLSYRFRADLSGVIDQSVDLQVLGRVVGRRRAVGSADRGSGRDGWRVAAGTSVPPAHGRVA